MGKWNSLLPLLVIGAGLAWLTQGLREPVLENPAEPPETTQSAIDVPPRPIVGDRRIGEYDAIVRRPLFSADRRPPKPVVSASGEKPAREPKAAGNDLSGMRLTAIFSGSGTNTAIAERANGERQVIRVGETLAEWKVLEIQEGKVTFGKGAQRRIFYLPDFSEALPPPRLSNAQSPLVQRAGEHQVPHRTKRVPRDPMNGAASNCNRQ